jgi:hypothetical protein
MRQRLANKLLMALLWQREADQLLREALEGYPQGGGG